MRPVDPRKHVPRFRSELDLLEEVETKANEIIETSAERRLLSGESPMGYAAAAIYAASCSATKRKLRRSPTSLE